MEISFLRMLIVMGNWVNGRKIIFSRFFFFWLIIRNFKTSHAYSVYACVWGPANLFCFFPSFFAFPFDLDGFSFHSGIIRLLDDHHLFVLRFSSYLVIGVQRCGFLRRPILIGLVRFLAGERPPTQMTRKQIITRGDDLDECRMDGWTLAGTHSGTVGVLVIGRKASLPEDRSVWRRSRNRPSRPGAVSAADAADTEARSRRGSHCKSLVRPLLRRACSRNFTVRDNVPRRERPRLETSPPAE